MDEVKELRVRKRDKEVEVNVQSDVVTALALLSVLVSEIEKEKGINAKKILDIVRDAIEIGKKEPVEKPKKRESELEALGTSIVKLVQENPCLHGAVIVDSYGIRIYSNPNAPVVYFIYEGYVPHTARRSKGGEKG